MGDINFDDWIKIMNFWLQYGRDKGWEVYNTKRLNDGDGFIVLDGFYKSDLFDYTVFFDEDEESVK